MALSFEVWGARGSIFTGDPAMVRYGGDTTCFSVMRGRGVAVLDAGSGMRRLGRALMARPDGPPPVVDLLLTHLHFDHICGLPFFEPLVARKSELRVWIASVPGVADVAGALRALMSPPLFPVDAAEWSNLSLNVVAPGASLDLAVGGRAMAFPLRHPGGACGWRIDCAEGSVVLASDHEAGDRETDDAIVAAARAADIMVLDAAYTAEEITACRGWGHSTWQQGAAIGARAGAKHIIMSHHMPERSDDRLDAMARAARAEDARIVFARSGLRITF